MIAANELRVGNWVSIESDDVLVDYHYLFFQIEAKHYGYLAKVGFDYVPIPLTEELLLKCGFVIRYDEYYGIETDSLYFNSYDFLHVGVGVQVFDNEGVKVILLEYLHQLQNFVHIHTGEELNVQL